MLVARGKLVMSDLRQQVTDMGFVNVKTYINSGNLSSFSWIVLVRTSVLGLNNSLQTIIPLSSIFPSFHKRSTRKITKNCLTGGIKTWLEREPSFSQRKCIKKELLSVSNPFL